MGRPPAYVFVVRHGRRLDAADKQWHLSSPTPYDPPLTYGGWMQSKTVGARIASIVREREAEEEANADAQDPIARKKKQKVYNFVIHSSPFLRCVQTSVAISAGLATPPTNTNPGTPATATRPSRSNSRRDSFSQPIQSRAATLPKIQTDMDTDLPGDSNEIDKTVLRLDPFLGEWLSPDYFEHITPPPKSSLMQATAKAELLRRENYNDHLHFHRRESTKTQGQLWSANPTHGSPLPPTDDSSGLESLSALNNSLPVRNSDSSEMPAGEAEPQGYVSPVPTYAISANEPIPKGFVAHARDHCADIDYQWDSASRPDLNWGDGGDLPEEWASMHQRFRRGLKRLVDWYANADNPGITVTKTPTSASPLAVKIGKLGAPNAYSPVFPGVPVKQESDVEMEDIVIIVSHGAGCNALVGAITQQPVLADVAMSSISMAQRRPEYDSQVNPLSNPASSPSLDSALLKKRITLAEVYEMKMFANTEHLQSPATPPSLSRSSSVASTNGGARARGFSALREINFGSQYGHQPNGSRSNSLNASLGSMRRPSSHQTPTINIRPTVYSKPSGGVTVGSGMSTFSGVTTRPSRSGSLGLWQPRDEQEREDEAENSMLLNFGSYDNNVIKDQEPVAKNEPQTLLPKVEVEPAEPPTPAATEMQHEAIEKFDDEPTPHLWAGTGNGGLWGAPRPPGEAEKLRDHTSAKRRWTADERD